MGPLLLDTFLLGILLLNILLLNILLLDILLSDSLLNSLLDNLVIATWSLGRLGLSAALILDHVQLDTWSTFGIPTSCRTKDAQRSVCAFVRDSKACLLHPSAHAPRYYSLLLKALRLFFGQSTLRIVIHRMQCLMKINCFREYHYRRLDFHVSLKMPGGYSSGSRLGCAYGQFL